MHLGTEVQTPAFRKCVEVDPTHATVGQGGTRRANRSFKYLLPKKKC